MQTADAGHHYHLCWPSHPPGVPGWFICRNLIRNLYAEDTPHSTIGRIPNGDSLDDKEKSQILPSLGGSTFLSRSLCWHGGARNIYDMLHKGLSARTSMLTGPSAYKRRCFLPPFPTFRVSPKYVILSSEQQPSYIS